MRFCTGMYKCFVGFDNARAHWSKAGGVWRTAHRRVGASADKCSLALPHLRWGLWSFGSWRGDYFLFPNRDYFCSQVGTIFSTFRHSRPWGDRVEDQSVYMICTFRHFRPGV